MSKNWIRFAFAILALTTSSLLLYQPPRSALSQDLGGPGGLRLYVTNRDAETGADLVSEPCRDAGHDTVAVVDPRQHDPVVRTISLDIKPKGVAVSPGGEFVYVIGTTADGRGLLPCLQPESNDPVVNSVD